MNSHTSHHIHNRTVLRVEILQERPSEPRLLEFKLRDAVRVVQNHSQLPHRSDPNPSLSKISVKYARISQNLPKFQSKFRTSLSLAASPSASSRGVAAPSVLSTAGEATALPSPARIRSANAQK